MTSPGRLSRHRHELYGVLTLIAFAAIAALVVAAYLQAFTPFTVATVKTDRSGLLLQRDADVTMHSVRIGKVGDITPDGPSAASIQILIEPNEVQMVPSNVTGDIVAPTVFGPKYVELVPPKSPTVRRLADGDVLMATSVQVEANVVFDNLIGVLQTVDPAKLNSALGAVSTALQGRGDQLGNYLGDLNRYLVQLNTTLPALRADLRSAPGVLDTYADVSPDLVRILGNLTTTSNTVVAEKPSLDALILSLTRFSDDTRTLLEANGDSLVNTLHVLRPTTALLQRYSPMFPCLFASTNYLRKVTEPEFGGEVPALRTFTSFLPGQDPYKYPQNLPRVGANAPGCYGGIPPQGFIPRHIQFPDGSPPLNTRDAPPTVGDQPLSTTLFGDLGPLAGQVLAPATAMTSTAPTIVAPNVIPQGGGR